MGRNVKMLPLLKSVGHFLKKLNICLSSNRAIPREMKIYVCTKTCKHMFIAALFIINKTTQASNSYTLQDIHTMEYYSEIKSDKLICATIWMNSKITKLIERRQTQECILYDSVYVTFSKMQRNS